MKRSTFLNCQTLSQSLIFYIFGCSSDSFGLKLPESSRIRKIEKFPGAINQDSIIILCKNFPFSSWLIPPRKLVYEFEVVLPKWSHANHHADTSVQCIIDLHYLVINCVTDFRWEMNLIWRQGQWLHRECLWSCESENILIYL